MNINKPFYLDRSPGATLSDISKDSLSWFIEQAKEQRNYAFSSTNKVEEILKQLVLTLYKY